MSDTEAPLEALRHAGDPAVVRALEDLVRDQRQVFLETRVGFPEPAECERLARERLPISELAPR